MSVAPIERKEDLTGTSAGDTLYWEYEFQSAEAEEKEWRKEAGDLVRKYRNEDNTQFNIFFSNVETLKPIIYSRTPKPDVRPEYNKRDPLARQISIMLEAAIDYNCKKYRFDDAMRAARDDRLMVARGVARVVYEPVLGMREEQVETVDPMTGQVQIVTQQTEEIVAQTLTTKFIHWEDYCQSPTKCWEEMRWIAFRHRPNRKQLVQQFPGIGEEVPLNYNTLADETRKEDGYSETEAFRRAEVWEIWDKESRKRLWFVKGFRKMLAVEDDPYQLEDFFPTPKPLLGITTNDKMVPVPDYCIYREQAAIINQCSDRISDLTDQLVVKGMYNAVSEEVQKVLNAKGNQFIPIVSVAPDTRLSDMVLFWPIEQIAQVLASLYQQREQAIQVIYQITGLSDIVRGSTKANETATAQQIKGNFATNRMLPLQQPMQEFVRDIIRLKAEIIAEHFTPETLAEMTGMPLQSVIDPNTGQVAEYGIEDMLPILRNDKLRGYRIDIETDTMVEADQDADKQRRTEFLQAAVQFITGVAPLVQTGALPMETAKAMLDFGMKGWKVSRELEDAMDLIGQQPPVQQPDPGAAQAQVETQKIEADMAKHEKELQFDAQENQLDRNTELAKALMQAGMKQQQGMEREERS